MTDTGYCPGGGTRLDLDRARKVRCPVCNRQLTAKTDVRCPISEPEFCVPKHKARVKRAKQPNRKPSRIRGRR